MARRPSAPITMMNSLTGFTALSAGLLLIFSSSSLLLQAQGGGGGVESYVPVRRVVYRSISPAAMSTEAAAPYEPFEVCRRCRCCVSPSIPSSCVDTNCCYDINCNLPGKPFGTCAFLPKTCGCGAANNCSQPAS
ncbi:uncharacterized protein LOC8083027 isoform X1 [Sorghum bicolor]|uniref:DUF7866 domain-containing protein n=1 Tax=Sorghum bicolor TaxID=4558 RepID=C5Y3K5_SORBI|nr:uncharacterized protein LOC8083027 isoform X1 [Sorghum bicolor]EES09158.2 hypothetical protein SORBI_3005G016900 [Sorghum bicolor]|eukprot:XP_021316794.1 uncharacterized protein LOC8083027 isoform X1 [Sorghum bicolor]